MKLKLRPCDACGALRTIGQLDAKPPAGANPETCNWTRLECETCYGPGYELGPNEDGEIAKRHG